jgi:hypothetical protein
MTAPKRDWLTAAGLTIVGTSTVVASFSALAGLAVSAGWNPWMSILLPATVDVYGVTATRIWLSADSSSEVRSHARTHALAALVVSMGGNAVNHAIEAHAFVLGHRLWLLVVAVSLVPPAALGALMHLVAIRAKRKPDAVQAETQVTGSAVTYASDLSAAALLPQGSSRVPSGSVTQASPARVAQGIERPVASAASQVTQKPAAKSPTAKINKSRRSDEELITDLNKIVADHYREHPGEEIKVLPVAKQLGIGRDRARALLDHMNVRPIRKATG